MKNKLRHITDTMLILVCSLSSVQALWSNCTIIIHAQHQTVCVGANVTIEVDESQSILMNCNTTVQWQYRNATQVDWIDLTQQGVRLEHTPTDAGIFTYRALLNCTDCGSDILYSNGVVVTVSVLPTISLAGITSWCTGTAKTLTATAEGGAQGATAVWQWGNDAFTTDGSFTPQNNLQPGEYFFKVSLKQMAPNFTEYPGCSANQTQGVKVNPLPTFNLVTDDEKICPGGSAFFKIINTAGGIPGETVNYEYTTPFVGATQLITDTFSVNNILSPGQLQVKVKASQSTIGCESIKDKTLMVENDPTVSIADNATVCQGNSVNLKAVVMGGTGNITNHEWIRKSGMNEITLPGTVATLTTDPSLPPGDYCYKVVVTQSAKGCIGTSSCVSANVAAKPEALLRIDNNGPSTICEGGNVKFAADLTGGLFCSLVWQKSSDGVNWNTFTSSSGNSHTETFIQPGTQHFRVITTGCNTGCRADTSEVVLVTINSDPIISGISVSPNEICMGGESKLVAQIIGGAGACTVSWDWASGGSWNGTGVTGTQLSVGGSGQYGTQSSGLKTYRAIYMCDGVGCDAHWLWDTLTVNPDLLASAMAVTPTVLCGDTLLKLEASHVGGVSNCTVYKWQKAVGSGNFEDLPVINPQNKYEENTSAAGSYQYRVIASCNVSGCESSTSAPVQVRVKQTPPILLNWPATSPAVCNGVESLTLNAVPTDLYSTVQYSWSTKKESETDWLAIQPAGETFTFEKFTTPTNFRVNVKTECGDVTRETLVRILPQPDTKILHGPTSACTGQTAMYALQSVPDLIDDTAEIVWSIVPETGGTVVKSYNYNAGVVIRWLASGTYKLRVTHKRGECQGTSEIMVNVSLGNGTQLSASPIHHYPFNNLLISTDSTAFCYQWYRYDSLTNVVEKIAGEQYQAYAAGEDYTPDRYAYFVKAWFGNCTNESSCAVVSYEVQEKSGYFQDEYSRLTVFPNPNKGVFNIKASEMPENVVISITNVNGTEVWEGQFDCHGGQLSERIELSEPGGVYLMTVTDSGEGGYRKTLRFVIVN